MAHSSLIFSRLARVTLMATLLLGSALTIPVDADVTPASTLSPDLREVDLGTAPSNVETEVTLTLAANDISFLVVVKATGRDDQAQIVDIEAPNGTLLTATLPDGSQNNGEAAQQWPVLVTQQVAAGDYFITVNGSTQVQVTAFIKSGNADAKQQIDVRFWKVTDSPEVDTPAEEAALAATWRQKGNEILGGVKLTVGSMEFLDAPAATIAAFKDLPLPTNQNPPDQSHREICKQFNAATGDERVLHFVLVDTIVDPDDPSGETLGNSSGIPGSPIESDWVSSCVIASGEGSNTFAANAVTAWHEAGHFLGLNHTTESTGLTFDYIPDTPQCDAATFDTNNDMNVSSVECAAADGTNFMFHDGDGIVISTGQAFVLKRSMLFRPLDALTVLATPCLAYDSNAATATGLGGILTNGVVRTVQISGALTNQGGAATCTVPADATAAIINIAAVSAVGAGNLRLSAAGVIPTGGVVNYSSNGLDNTNTVTIPLSPAGQVDVAANASSSHTQLSVIGYYSRESTLTYFPLTPCAAADSRVDQNPGGLFVGPFAPGANYPDVDVVGDFPAAQGSNNGVGGTSGITSCGVPATANAVAVNVVATIPQGGAGGLAVGAGGTEPTAMITRFAAIDLNNAAVSLAPVDGAGKIAVNVVGTSGTPTVNIRLVVLGYVDDVAGGLNFNRVNPCAIFDSRPGEGAIAPFLGLRDGASTTTYQVTGVPAIAQGGAAMGCGIPAGTSAVVINVVAVNAAAIGNLRIYATGTTPTGGVLNFAGLAPQMNNSNSIVVPLSAAGQLSVDTNTGPTNIAGATNIRGVVVGYLS